MTSHLNKKWFDSDLQHLLKILSQPGTLYLPLTPMGKKKTIFHSIHTIHRKLFLHKGICINIERLQLIRFSVSRVNIVLFKGKVGANFHIFKLPRSLPILCKPQGLN